MTGGDPWLGLHGDLSAVGAGATLRGVFDRITDLGRAVHINASGVNAIGSEVAQVLRDRIADTTCATPMILDAVSPEVAVALGNSPCG
ncbi:MAG: hypothetical protein JO147_10655 [Actinobacteria bacterium]|nr:hypothetical protein [Actinomycetota bacterium]